MPEGAGYMDEQFGLPEELQHALYGKLYDLNFGNQPMGGQTNRIEDDNTGRSGGAGAGTGAGAGRVAAQTVQPSTGATSGEYGAGARARLADLIKQKAAADAPPPPESTKSRLLRAAINFGGAGAAALSGLPGSTTGAAQAIDAGVARRHQVQDRAQQERFTNQQRLAQEIQATSSEINRDEMERARMTEQENLRRISEEGLTKRLGETLTSREKVAQGQDETRRLIQEMRDRDVADTNKTRMEVQRSKNEGAAAVARIRAATAGQKKNPPPILAKAVDDFETSQSRYDVMQTSYQQAMADPGNQQAMLNLLANHLGMTMGLQKGARLNQAIIEEAKRSGYLDERVEAHYGPDGFMTGVVLTPRQMTQMLDLAGGRLTEDSRKAQELEMYFNYQGGMAIKPRTGAQTAKPNQPNQPQQQAPPAPRPGFKTQQRKRPDGTIEYRQVPEVPGVPGVTVAR